MSKDKQILKLPDFIHY
jgi:hypothetical protein